jgi:hypothetical protein
MINLPFSLYEIISSSLWLAEVRLKHPIIPTKSALRKKSIIQKIKKIKTKV